MRKTILSKNKGLVKFVHGIIFDAIWFWTWFCGIVTGLSLLVVFLSGLTAGSKIDYLDSSQQTDPHSFSAVLFLMLIITLGAFSLWFSGTLGGLMVAYFTRPQAWGSLSEEVPPVILPIDEPPFQKSIYNF